VRIKLRAGGYVSGRVVSADETGAVIDVDGEETAVAYQDMRKARARVDFGAGE
jgi:ribosome maturation factor rimP